jgi:hypothetical protein
MNWAWQDGGEPVITPHEADVILRHPLVDPLPAALAGLSALAQAQAPVEWLGPMPGACATCAMAR